MDPARSGREVLHRALVMVQGARPLTLVELRQQDTSQ
jgi:hypothetical protein